LQSVIVRLKTGIQAGVHKTLGSAFTLWKSAVEHYNQYRATTLTYCFTKVRFTSRAPFMRSQLIMAVWRVFVIIVVGICGRGEEKESYSLQAVPQAQHRQRQAVLRKVPFL
jgi:hypothetical protein